MSDGIVEFLTERLAEDEQVAQAASGRRWGHDGYGGWHVPFGSSRCTVVRDMSPFSHEQDNHVCGSALAPDAEHIARHDPARVLAEVAAKRRMVDQTFRYEATIDGEWGCCHSADEIARGECPATPVDGIGMLRLLAVVYADHADYRSDWAPHE